MLEALKTLAIDGIDLKQLSINGVMAWVAPPSFTNWVPISIDTDGSIFNGCGYKENQRLNSSGTLTEKYRSVATGFIPAKGGDTICIDGVNWASTADSGNYICAYDSSFSLIGTLTSSGVAKHTRIAESVTLEGEMGIVKLEALDNIAYIRVSSYGDNTVVQKGENMIITVNEEIV